MDEMILLAYLRGECSDEEAGLVEAWCEKAPENRKVLEQLYYTLFVGDRVAVMNTVDTEASLKNLKSAIREKEKKNQRKEMSIRWGRYATAAVESLGGCCPTNFRITRC
jgi:transmembrane sensor